MRLLSGSKGEDKLSSAIYFSLYVEDMQTRAKRESEQSEQGSRTGFSYRVGSKRVSMVIRSLAQKDKELMTILTRERHSDLCCAFKY